MKKLISICVSILLLLSIGIQAQAQEVEVIGSLKVVDGTEGVGKVLTSDADGLATWSNVLKPITNLQTDKQTRNMSVSWVLGPVFSNITGFRAGSKLKISYHVPTRNDELTWGGAYIEPQISFDDGATWNSLGSSGYDGGVMANDAQLIGSYNNTLLIDPNLPTNFSVKIRMYYRAYTASSTLVINGNHDINNISGTATLMAGDNGLQHYTHVIVEEVF